MKIRVILADDHVLMRQGLAQVLNANPAIDVIGECGDGQELTEQVIRRDPDVVLMDISMPKMSGLVAIDKILTQRPQAKIIALSMHNELEYINAMRDAGAKGYIVKESSSDMLIKGIKAVQGGMTAFYVNENEEADGSGQRVNPLAVLTRREREVFFLVVAGNTSKQIGELLAMSVKTAENHRGNIYKKLNVNSSAEIIRLAGKAGLLE